MTTQNTTTQPLDSLKIGMLEVTIWKNDAEKGPPQNITISRRYRDGDEYKTAYSFGPADLATVKVLTDWAIKRVIEYQLVQKTVANSLQRSGG